MPDYPQIPKQKSKPSRFKLLRGSIFHRELVRESASMGLLVFAILLGIVVFTQLVRLLGQSVKRFFGGGWRAGIAGF